MFNGQLEPNVIYSLEPAIQSSCDLISVRFLSVKDTFIRSAALIALILGQTVVKMVDSTVHAVSRVGSYMQNYSNLVRHLLIVFATPGASQMAIQKLRLATAATLRAWQFKNGKDLK